MEENFTQTPQSAAEQPKGIILLQDAQSYLVTAGKWARFLGVMGFIVTGLVVFAALFIGTMISAISSLSPLAPVGLIGAASGLISGFYILMAIVNFFLSLYLYQFGTKVKNGVAFQSSAEVTVGLGKLKAMFKMVGIITIIVLIMYVVAIIGFIVFASHAAQMVTPGY